MGHPLAGLVSISNKVSKALVRRHANHNGFKNTHPIHFISGYGADPHQTPIGIKVITAPRDTPASREAQKTVGVLIPVSLTIFY